ncbi:MAG TPA: tRNA adenosine(34) deaminase TadA [Deltaproteobacteria bacterium]|nr:tRNA adenosine(34) deaminase TadA [Deltaproteobacteria bacterium]
MTEAGYDDCALMEIALDEARAAANEGEVPVGAVLLVDGRLYRGHNRVIADHDPTAHAEIMAIRNAAKSVGNYRLPGSVLCVTLEPCAMCAGAIVQARIGRLVYGARDPRYGAVESLLKFFELDINHKPVVCAGTMEQRASALLKSFFQERRNGEVPKWS